ncbi:MAG: hypothetical protein IJS14_00880 [Lentisphaeria bacterium]|nr:hypothetical protein [Lentisphaeria bacterium]
MKKEYQSIFEKLKQRGGNQIYEWFQAYGDPNLKNGLMVVGRAVRDWNEFQIDEAEFDDLYEENSKPLVPGGDIETFFRENSEYNINDSPFWRTVRNTTKGLFDCNDRNFGKYIIYSDLYKIALPGKNPNQSLKQLELPECMEILRKEIQLWKPAYILFLTGWEWVDPFLVNFEQKDGLKCKDKSQNDDLLEDWGQFPDGCHIAVIPHPQAKLEKLLSGKAIAFFQDFSGLQEKLTAEFGLLDGKWNFNSVQEEIRFSLPPVWNNRSVPLTIQTDLNMLCFRIGIWSRDEKWTPLCQLLSQKLGRVFKCNSAWQGGYTEVKFHETNSKLINLVRDIYTIFRS